MTATLRLLLRRPELGLSLLVPAAPVTSESGHVLDRQIRWVATSELGDPTPYLQGGELLLTNGIGVPKSRPAIDRYVARLVDAGVVGIGFAVGTVHAAIPPGLVASARNRGLPLVAVDEPTPFIAVGEAVSELLAKEQYGEIVAAYDAQQEITRAALRQGAAGVVSRLATSTGGWVVLLDPHGDVVEASRRTTAAERESWLPELERLHSRGPATATTVDAGEHRTIQSLGASGRVRGYLVTGAAGPQAPTTAHRALVNVAAALLTFSLAHEGGARDRLARSALMTLAMRLPEQVTALLPDLAGPVFEAGELWVVAAGGAPADLETWHQQLEDEGRSHCFPWSERGGDAKASAPGGQSTADLILVAVSDEHERDRLLGLQRPAVTLGASERVATVALAAARDQAINSLRVAVTRRVPSLSFSDLGRLGLAAVVDPEAAAAFAAATLERLTAYERASHVELLESLRAWLGHHGQYEPAAASLGIHRHTLRYRVRKASSLMGRDLDDPAVRMDLWFALTVQSGQR